MAVSAAAQAWTTCMVRVSNDIAADQVVGVGEDFYQQRFVVLAASPRGVVAPGDDDYELVDSPETDRDAEPRDHHRSGVHS